MPPLPPLLGYGALAYIALLLVFSFFVRPHWLRYIAAAEAAIFGPIILWMMR
jgi:hypothetical protein